MMARATVPDAMSAAFARAGGDLAERLMTALEGAEAEGGDVRGRQSAALLVAPAQGEPWQARIDLRVEDHADPVGELRRLLGLQRAYELAGRRRRADGRGPRRTRRPRSTCGRPSWRRSPTSCCSGPASRSPRTATSDGGADAVRRAAAVHPGWLTLLDRLSPEFAPAGAAGAGESRGASSARPAASSD